MCRPNQVAALRGSVPADALADFRHVLAKHGRFRYSTRPQIGDILAELEQPRWAVPAT